MFSSRSYDLQSPQGNYLWNAYNTDASMLHWLKKAGYSTHGYLYPVYRFPLSLFDKTIDFILLNPEGYPEKRSPYREILLEKFPYLIIYELDKKRHIIYILHVFHTRRNPKLKYRHK
jgi:hypothetical protein